VEKVFIDPDLGHKGQERPMRVHESGKAALSGCGSKYVPGVSIPPAPSKTPPPASTGKGGTYKPYTVLGQTYYPLGSAEGYSETGVASWYGTDFHGKKTANGERYDMYQMTAAHKNAMASTAASHPQPPRPHNRSGLIQRSSLQQG